MDKYTVDLDKVLNDFEYSELTDNFSAARNYPSQASSNYASSSKSKSGEAKHSITNVFNSLNEYLNTDISCGAKVNGDNKPPKEGPTVYRSPYINNKLENALIFDNNKKHLTFISEGAEGAKKSNAGQPEAGRAGKSLLDDEAFVKNNLFDTYGADSKVNINNVNELGCYDAGRPSLLDADNLECQPPVGLLDTENKDCNVRNENNAAEAELNREKATNVAAEAAAAHLDKSETQSVDSMVEAEAATVSEDVDLGDWRFRSVSDAKELHGTVAVENLNLGREASSEIRVVDLSESAGETVETESDAGPKVAGETVGFDDTLDVDETELNKYLDDLENEMESMNGALAGANVAEPNLKEEIGAVKDVKESTGDENECETEAGSERPNVVVLLPADTAREPAEASGQTQDTDGGCGTASASRNEVSEGLNGSDEITCVFRRKSGEGKDINSMERPRSLDVSDDNLDVPAKREINLIGNPGSTPYNNVYISKELQSADGKNENVDASESSSSVSPTFSEVSTDTINSTDLNETDSENEKEAKAKKHGGKTKDKSQAEKEAGVKERVEAAAAVDEDCVATGEVKSSGDSVETVPSADACEAGGSVANSDEVLSKDEECRGEDGGAAPESAGTGVPNLESHETSDMDFNWLGKQAPLWLPDSEALHCLHCDVKFTVIKRRHHCRACGLVLCSKCCNLKHRLEYLDSEARVCAKCYAILNRDSNSSSGSDGSPLAGNSPHRQAVQPNPNNPMEYCSVVPPLQQVSGATPNPPTVMVPVGVLKRKGSNKGKSNKSVMFCDGIRPGSDLTKLDTDFNYSVQKSTSSSKKSTASEPPKADRSSPAVDPVTNCFIPSSGDCLPPSVTVVKSDVTYTDCTNNESMVETLKGEKVTFALHRNLHVHLQIINMSCCINKRAWCFSTEGLMSVGQDEVVYLVEFVDDESAVPVDVFHHINSLYTDALKGTTVTEMGISLHNTPNFLDFKNHAGFLYIRPTFQCLQNVIRPSEPYLIGILIHRWETPWAKIFPLRLVLRLGAEYRYYPSPIISTRHRDSVFVEIGHTIINLLADFRNFSYSLPNIRGLTIHMEDKNTTVTIPVNRYDQVMKSLNNSSDHILAFGGNFSSNADSHLVCIQDTQGSNENSYTTHAINIHNKPRKVTGASFIVFNGALKSSSGLTAKSSIVEDGLMIQIPPDNMVQVRESLRNMKSYTIQCGCINSPSDETVSINWGEPDTNFNIGVTSPIDNQSLGGIPSIRVHNGKDFVCSGGKRLIRWTEVFILQNTEENSKSQDPVDVSKISESISKATCQALVKYLDLLTSNNFYKIGIRATLHVENVSYSAGSNNTKLPPIYMKNLDNELVPVLHKITSNNLGETAIVLELIFRILNT